MTPAQVETAARRRYNSESSTFWSQDEVFKTIYEGECVLAKEALCIEAKDTSTSTVSGTQTYSFPSNWISIKRLEYDGVKLKPINFREDDSLTLNNASTTTTGTPTYYYIWNDTIYLRPIPDAAETLTLYGYKEPTLLTTASTTLSVPTRYHTALIEYVASIMAAKDENLQLARFYEDRWLAEVEKAVRYERKKKRGDSFATAQDEESLAETVLGFV